MTIKTRRHVQTLMAAMALMLVLAACSGDAAKDEPTATRQEPTATVQVTTAATSEEAPTETASPTTAASPTSASSPPATTEMEVTGPIEPYSGDVDSVDAATFDVDGDGSFRPEEMEDALGAIYQYYVWPPDYYLSLNTILSWLPTEGRGPNGEVLPVSFASEDFRGAIDVSHRCAWILQWAVYFRAGHTELADQTLDVLYAVSQDMAMADYDRGRFLGWIDQARLGDPSMVMMFVDSPRMCGGRTWDSPPADASASSDSARSATSKPSMEGDAF